MLVHLNKTKLYEQIEFNKKRPEEELYTIGNFEWEDKIDGNVQFHPDPNGRFKVAWLPSRRDNSEHLKNRVKKDSRGWFHPLNTKFVRFGCDPFSYKSTHGKGSKGSIHGKTVTLPEGISPELSNKFVIEYIARPSDEIIFFEDVIKVVRFYGSPFCKVKLNPS